MNRPMMLSARPRSIHILGYSIMALAPAFLGAGQVGAQTYTDVATQHGLTFLVPPSPEYFDVGCGVSFHDFDGDGQDDLSFGTRGGEMKFFRNEGGALLPMPSFVSSTGSVKSILWADIDNDGDSDLLLTTYHGLVRLFRNDGNWSFTEITAGSGLLATPGRNWGASFGDYDRDGLLDLYVCTYIPTPEPYAFNKINHLYHNNGNGTFTDVTLAAGVGNGLLPSFQSVWQDVDLDGWPDLYVINDFAGANALYRNNHDGTFTDIAVQTHLAEAPEHCMSISFSDFDLDGDQDLFMTNTGIYPQINKARWLLEVNNGNGTFTESSVQYGTDVHDWGWGSLWVDQDNDGYEDLYVGTHVYNVAQLPATDDVFLRNLAGNGFASAPEAFNGSLLRYSYAVARGDLDGDGYPDIAVGGEDPYPPALWLSSGGSSSYVRIGVSGSISNRQGIGTWIKVYANGKMYSRYTKCGENFIGQSSPYEHFGLAQATVIDSVTVQYLSGHTDRYYGLAVDTLYRFKEGDTFRPSIHAPGSLAVCAPSTIVLDAGTGVRYLWNTGDTTRLITVSSTGHFHARVTNAFGIAAESDTVRVVVGPDPEVIAHITDPTCAGDASGSILLENLAGTPPQSVIWTDGAAGNQRNGLHAGAYTYAFTDTIGCSASGTVDLQDPDTLMVLAWPVAATDGTNGSFSWSGFGGTPPYSATVDHAPAQSPLTGIPPGAYLLELTDASGCTSITTVVVPGSTGIADPVSGGFRIFPNPVRDLLHAEGPWKITAWKILDAEGRTIQSGSTLENGQLDASMLAPGCYMLDLLPDKGQHSLIRFVKQP